jgi:hypothetical protein
MLLSINTDEEVKDFSFIFAATHMNDCLVRFRGAHSSKNIKTNFVLVQAAVHPIEQPEFFYPIGTVSFVESLRFSVDFVITQNNRMKDLIWKLSALFSGFSENDRILTSQLVPKSVNVEALNHVKDATRRKLGIRENDIVIVNAGGAWKWTLFNEFISVFSKHLVNNPTDNLFFIQPALTQFGNSAHSEYQLESKRILSELPKFIRERIYIGESWESSKIPIENLILAGDYGLNLNFQSLENWQSYRVRILEYISYGLPVICSTGSFWDEEDVGMGFIFCQPTEDGIRGALATIVNSHHEKEILVNRKMDVNRLRLSMTLENQSEVTINSLLKHDKRFKSKVLRPGSIWDFSPANLNGTLFGSVLNRLKVWVSSRGEVHDFLVSIGVRFVYRKWKTRSNKPKTG